jgi:hypothetical protein
MTFVHWIVSAGAVAGAVSVIHHTLIRPVFKWMTRIEQAVTVVEGNMVNNGGSSLRDAVDRIENRLTVLELAVTAKPKAPRVTKK